MFGILKHFIKRVIVLISESFLNKFNLWLENIINTPLSNEFSLLRSISLSFS